jgi:hypothetical protein
VFIYEGGFDYFFEGFFCISLVTVVMGNKKDSSLEKQ